MEKFNINFAISEKSKKMFKSAFIIVVLIASIIVIKNQMEYSFGFDFWSPESADEEFGVSEEDCNVSGIALRGGLVTYISNENLDEQGQAAVDQTSSESVVHKIREAENDDKIRAIILEIDSSGGSSIAGEEIANALKKSDKLTISLIRGIGTSASYYAASGADVIFASKNSDVGGIGVTMSYLEYALKNQKEGLVYRQLSSGIFKDAGDPDKPLTSAEKDLFMRDVKISHENFIKAVAENRNLDVDKVKELADGSSMMGEMALQSGLIDKIGSQAEVENYLAEEIGEEAEICW